MPTIRFQVHTDLDPDTVLGALTDFGPRRAEVWPNIDADHFEVHAQGPGWAEVTEGSSVAGGVWERSRYEWDAATRRLAAVTHDSNTWGPGSCWDYRLSPAAGGGTEVAVRVVRFGKGARGRLLGLAIGLAGARRLRSDTERVLRRVAAGRAR